MIFFFFWMIFFPKEAFIGAQNGLLLWFQMVMPTLLPFFIMTNLLLYTNSFGLFLSGFSPFICRVFRVSKEGSFPVLIGFLCGYPVGAKITADLIQKNKITYLEGCYILSFCSNLSPSFLSSYVVLQNLKEKSLMVPTLIILYLSPLICSFLFRRYYRIPKTCGTHRNTLSGAEKPSPLKIDFAAIDSCILDAFESAAKIGGYLMLFSILISLGRKLSFLVPLLPLLEITTGIPMILSLGTSFETSYVVVLSLTSFGGFCAAAQCSSMVKDVGISIRPYLIQKLITAGVTSLLAYLYIAILN